jgi:hypothetical protein
MLGLEVSVHPARVIALFYNTRKRTPFMQAHREWKLDDSSTTILNALIQKVKIDAREAEYVFTV